MTLIPLYRWGNSLDVFDNGLGITEPASRGVRKLRTLSPVLGCIQFSNLKKRFEEILGQKS